MIRPLAAFLHMLDAARTADTLARTVRVLARQLDNAHLLAASEGARADRAEADHSAEQMARRRITAERDDARERVAELEAQLDDWREASGELAAEQPADDALPDLADAGEAPIPIPLTNPAREAEIQQDRADALAAALRAAEMDLIKLRAELESVAERKLAADIRADVQRERAEQAERERDTNARAAGAHIATINDLRARLDLALSAVHRPAPTEQIPGVAAVGPYAEWSAEYDAIESARERAGTDDPPPRIASREARYAAVMRRSDEITAGTDDSPPTRPSERAATRTT